MPHSMEGLEEQRPAAVVLNGDQGITEAGHRGTTLVAFLTRITMATTALSTSATR